MSHSGTISKSSGLILTGFSSSASSISFNVPNSYRGIIFTFGTNANLNTIIMIVADSSGNLNVKDITGSTLLTHTETTNKITFNTTSTKNIYYYVINSTDGNCITKII